MKKKYIQPLMNDGLSADLSHFLLSSLRTQDSDDVNIQISNSGATGAAEGRGSFWDDTEK